MKNHMWAPRQYDAAGNVLYDGMNTYQYDGAGRLCAVANGVTGAVTQYVYGADGSRTARINGGSVTAGTIPSCNKGVPSNPTELFVTDPGGHEVTELTVSGTSWQWERTNIYAAGGLLATGDAHGLHFHLSDWLGNRRVQVAGAAGQAAAEGTVELQCSNEVWGVSLNCASAGADATEQHFTGKESDVESGNDYFGARYYSPNTGRFMSPDWSSSTVPVPYADMSDPQSLNLYAYVQNNPVTKLDATGHIPVIGNYSDGAPGCGGSSQCMALSGYPGNDAVLSPSRGTCPGCAMQEGEKLYEETIVKQNDAAAAQNRAAKEAQQQDLSSKSDKAIDKAAKKYGYDASAFENAMTQAGSKYKLDPNLLVGLASRESSLNPFQKNGGLFQIQDPASYGLSASDIYSFQAQISAAAKTLSSNIQSFGGNVDLGIASWTLGLGGTRHLFSSGGMNSVRSAWLDRNHHDYGQVGPNYVDVIEAFTH